MFDTSLIPKNVSAGLEEGYEVRPVSADDYEHGVLDVLKVLTTVGPITREEFHAQTEYWAAHKGTYFPVVISNPDKHVVACGMLVVERKLIHHCGLVGHIEDIAVAADQQGLKLGKRLINALTGIAEKTGCYKVILDCDEKNVGFYEKCGYKRAGVEMGIRF